MDETEVIPMIRPPTDDEFRLIQGSLTSFLERILQQPPNADQIEGIMHRFETYCGGQLSAMKLDRFLDDLEQLEYIRKWHERRAREGPPLTRARKFIARKISQWFGRTGVAPDSTTNEPGEPSESMRA